MTRILIVEDDLDLIETYTDLLTMHDHEVHSAIRLEEAFEVLEEVSPQIIMLDLQLPGARAALLAEFVQTAKRISGASIIIVSGHPEMMSSAGLLDAVDLVLVKPVHNPDLLSFVDRMIKMQPASAAHRG
ncbi:MAG: response regulator [Anaerolineae bacterium]|nr:response regulator [Anaerolineae bacterium]NUQ04522.1 response regulator transcription factor [Anaerolineae bacterium]